MGSLTPLQQALTITDGTLKAGNKIHTEPFDGRRLRQRWQADSSATPKDGSSMMRPDIAIAKAWGAPRTGLFLQKTRLRC